jgi:hypothetical protein
MAGVPNGLDRSCEATIYPVLDKPHNSGIKGGLKLLEICPPVFKVSFTIGLNGRYKSLRHGYLCFPEIVTGDEQASA